MNKASRRNGLDRLAALDDATREADDRMGVHRARFARLARPESAPRVVSAFNLFQTPPALAALLVARLGPIVGLVLEPSAGLGRIYYAVKAVDKHAGVTLVDNSPECCRELFTITEGDENAHLIQRDFLELTPQVLGLFSHIVMNPPFKCGTDVRHVLHARQFLAPGGRLVSIVAAGPRQKATLQPIATAWHDLPAGSFKSEGTNVETAIVVFDAPPAMPDAARTGPELYRCMGR